MNSGSSSQAAVAVSVCHRKCLCELPLPRFQLDVHPQMGHLQSVCVRDKDLEEVSVPRKLISGFLLLSSFFLACVRDVGAWQHDVQLR